MRLSVCSSITDGAYVAGLRDAVGNARETARTRRLAWQRRYRPLPAPDPAGRQAGDLRRQRRRERGRHVLERRRHGQAGPPARRPHHHERPADHVLDRHRSLAAGVLRDAAVVAHHEDLARLARCTSSNRRDRHSPGRRRRVQRRVVVARTARRARSPLTVTRPWRRSTRPGRRAAPITRLMKSFSPGRLTPTRSPTVRPSLATNARRAGLGRPRGAHASVPAEHDDLAALRVADVVDDLVDQHPVADRAGCSPSSRTG